MQDVPEPDVGETGRGTPERVGVSERVDLYTGTLGKALGGASCVNTSLFRSKMTDGGFEILPGEHPIVPVMYGEARDAADVAERLLAEGIYVIPFFFPVVPRGQARIRTQLSAAHSTEDVERLVAGFHAVRDAPE